MKAALAFLAVMAILLSAVSCGEASRSEQKTADPEISLNEPSFSESGKPLITVGYSDELNVESVVVSA